MASPDITDVRDLLAALVAPTGGLPMRFVVKLQRRYVEVPKAVFLSLLQSRLTVRCKNPRVSKVHPRLRGWLDSQTGQICFASRELPTKVPNAPRSSLPHLLDRLRSTALRSEDILYFRFQSPMTDDHEQMLRMTGRYD